MCSAKPKRSVLYTSKKAPITDRVSLSSKSSCRTITKESATQGKLCHRSIAAISRPPAKSDQLRSARISSRFFRSQPGALPLIAWSPLGRVLAEDAQRKSVTRESCVTDRLQSWSRPPASLISYDQRGSVPEFLEAGPRHLPRHKNRELLVELPQLHTLIVQEHSIQPHVVPSAQVLESVLVRAAHVVRQRDDDLPVVVRVDREEAIL